MRTTSATASAISNRSGAIPTTPRPSPAALAAVRASPRLPLGRHDVAGAVAALVGWLVTLRAAPVLLRHDRFHGGRLGAIDAFLLALLVVFAVVRVLQAGALAGLPAIPLLALLVPPIARDPAAALLVLLVAALAAAFAHRHLLLRLPASGLPARLRS